jgi:hypothetical protein
MFDQIIESQFDHPLMQEVLLEEEKKKIKFEGLKMMR